MDKELAGKVALVTGASRGIGAATALGLARAGADVAISYAASAEKAQDIVKELKGFGVRAAAYRADQADPAQVAELVAAVARDFGRLDILVNNAGVIAMGQVGDPAADQAALDRQYAINLGGVVAAIRAAARDLGPRGITVNVVQPGPTATDMNPDSGDFAASLKAETALGRYARPEEIASAIVFLAGPGASYITGTELTIDGGLNA